MVHIKLSATFVLAAAAIAPVVAQPIVEHVPGHHSDHTEHGHDAFGVSRLANVGLGLHNEHHPNHASSAIDSSPDSSRGNDGPSRREYVNSLGIRDQEAGSGGRKKTEQYDSSAQKPPERGEPENRRSSGRPKHQPDPKPLKRREYIAIQDLLKRSLEELEFEARDFADFDDLNARDFEDEFYLD